MVIAEDASFNCLTCDQRYSNYKHNRNHKVQRADPHSEFWGHDRCHRHRYHHHSRHSADNPQNIQPADPCFQSPGGQRRLQTSPKDVTSHSSKQRAAEPHRTQLCVGQHGQLQPGFRERLPTPPSGAEQRGGKPPGAVQHRQRLHRGHHPRHPIIRKHIATRPRFSLTTGTD